MQVTFQTPKLQKQYETARKAIKAYGPEVGRKYIGRINILKSAADIAEVKGIRSLRFHPLTGNLKGLYSITLHGRWRLILKYDESEADIIGIKEVSKHYGD